MGGKGKWMGARDERERARGRKRARGKSEGEVACVCVCVRACCLRACGWRAPLPVPVREFLQVSAL